jgi:nucleotide-binding universal stress UspA family protein
MFKHLLVPLDGSEPAEAALPAASYLAGALGASITLLHLIERDAPAEIHGHRHLRGAAEAQTYLAEIARRLPAGAPVSTHVHEAQIDNVAAGIAAHIRELAPDLIVMCEHGGAGLRGFLYGSMAQQALALGTIPVLLLRPGRSQPAFALRRLLVALDGTPEHEAGLEPAAALARACGAELHLLLVVPTVDTLPGNRSAAGRLLPGAMTQALELEREECEAYLRGQTARLAADGLSVRAEIRRGDPASVIAKGAHAAGVDLIVLATHGKAGMDALWAGSTAARVVSRTKIPILLVPVRTSSQTASFT